MGVAWGLSMSSPVSVVRENQGKAGCQAGKHFKSGAGQQCAMPLDQRGQDTDGQGPLRKGRISAANWGPDLRL
jgi:hypothetical protein